MMKRIKANDGYALGFVLIVLVVLCTIAIGVSSISLNNLKNQQRSIDRMTAKYEAQGLIEQVVAQLEAYTGDDIESQAATIQTEMVANGHEISLTPDISNSHIITVTAKVSNHSINAVLNLTKNLDPNDTAVITGYSVKYTSYSTEVTS